MLENNLNDNVSVREKKQQLRKQIRAKTKDLSLEELDRESNQVWNQVFDLELYKDARSVGLFLSMPKGEINTDPILQHAIEHGKHVYVPQVGKNFEKCDMELVKVIIDNDDNNNNQKEIFHKSWPKNKWQIPEPPPDMPIVAAQPGDIDLLIVPGLGFDRKANRLGQGKGYYDRFIARMTANHTIRLPLVAVALSAQFVDDTDVPVAEYDQRMDMVVLPNQIIYPENTKI